MMKPDVVEFEGEDCDVDPLSVAVEEEHYQTAAKLLDLGIPPQGE